MSQFNLMFLALDDFDLDSLAESLKDEAKFFENYLYEEPNGHWSVEEVYLDSVENVVLLSKYLFGKDCKLSEIFSADYAKVFDLSIERANLTTYENFEEWYQDWIAESNRENTMNEYGQLICAIGYIRNHQSKKNLLMILQNRN